MIGLINKAPSVSLLTLLSRFFCLPYNLNGCSQNNRPSRLHLIPISLVMPIDGNRRLFLKIDLFSIVNIRHSNQDNRLNKNSCRDIDFYFKEFSCITVQLT